MIIKQYSDKAGIIQIYWLASNNKIYRLSFVTQPTTTEIEEKVAIIIENSEYENETPINFDTLGFHIELIKELIVLIRNNPTVGLTAYNNYLNSKIWYEKDILRYFMYSLTVALAERNKINITEYTEANVLLYVRNWIVNTDINKIKKLILNIVL